MSDLLISFVGCLINRLPQNFIIALSTINVGVFPIRLTESLAIPGFQKGNGLRKAIIKELKFFVRWSLFLKLLLKCSKETNSPDFYFRKFVVIS